jgi:translation initiation factor eIF-2B subunit alpha
MFKELKALGIDCKLVVDGAIGLVLEKVDYVVTGAKVVTENGGVVNSLGTYTLGICANAMKKPVYAFAENYKFMRTFVINQKDIPKDNGRMHSFSVCSGEDIAEVQLRPDDVFGAANDFTPSDLIAYIVSDSRIFKSSGVSDEFLQTFNL